MSQSKFAAVSMLLVATALGLSGAPIGNLSIGIAPGGGVAASANLLDWFLPMGGGFGDFTNGGSSITWSGGVLNASTNPYGRIADIPVGTFPTNFIQFYTLGSHNPATPGSGTMQTLPTFDLIGVGPGSSTSCTTNPGVDQSCSISVTSSSIGPYMSPIILTQRANGTDVSLNVTLLGTDANGSVNWSGLATTQVAGMTPAQIQSAINAGGTVNVQSWSFNAQSLAIPEPATLTFSVVGLAAFAFGALRRRRSGE